MTTTELMGGFVLSELAWHSLTDAQVAEGVELNNALQAEVLPDDPPGTVEDALAALHATPTRMRRWMLRVHDADGRLVGAGGCSYDPEHDDNPDIQWMGLNVLPRARRRGIGTALLRRLVEIAEAERRPRLVSGSNDGLPAGRAFAEALGATAKQASHLNHLPTAEVDRAQLTSWVAAADERSSGYELLAWDGRCPDEHLDAFVALIPVMNTAPTDDLEIKDFTVTAPQVREHEDRFLAMGCELWTLVARERATGELVGLHDVSWMPSEAELVWVGATGVRPEHRGHALGKWLKAAMTLRVLDERPLVTSIRTGNADSNDAMLGINKAMGYRPLLGQTTWELSLADAQSWLATRPARATTPSR